jgi:hypothetical protein
MLAVEVAIGSAQFFNSVIGTSRFCSVSLNCFWCDRRIEHGVEIRILADRLVPVCSAVVSEAVWSGSLRCRLTLEDRDQRRRDI